MSFDAGWQRPSGVGGAPAYFDATPTVARGSLERFRAGPRSPDRRGGSRSPQRSLAGLERRVSATAGTLERFRAGASSPDRRCGSRSPQRSVAGLEWRGSAMAGPIGGVPLSVPPLDLECSAVQRTIDAEVAARRAAKQELSDLVHSAEIHIRQILASCKSASSAQGRPTASAVDRVLRNIAGLVEDLRYRQAQWSRLEDGSGLASEERLLNSEPHDVLRSSLASAQRRCASLNEDMLRVADANEELMSTMQAVKNTNRRLVDQIQSQNSDLERLTKLRVQDEERMEKLRAEQRAQVRALRHEHQEKIDAAEAEAAKAYDERRMQLVSRLKCLREGLQGMSAKLRELRQAQVLAAAEAKSTFAAFRVEILERVGRRLAERFKLQRRDEEKAIALLEDETHAKAARINVEKEARQRESAAWCEKDENLSSENRSLAFMAEHAASRLRAEIDSQEEALHVETKEDKQADRTARLCDAAVEAASLGGMLAAARSALAVCDTHRQSDEAYRRHLDESWQKTNSRLREADAALDRAVAGNEELRRLLEASRAESHRVCEAEIQRQRALGKAKLKQTLETQRSELESIENQVNDLAQRAGEQACEVVRLELQVERRTSERAAAQRACAVWRAQEELAVQLKDEVARDFQAARQAWDIQLRTLRDEQESLATRQEEVETELRLKKEQFAEYSRSAEIRAEHLRRSAESLTTKFQETEEAVSAAKRALQDKVNILTRLRCEASGKHTVTLQLAAELERELRRLSREAAATREAFGNQAGLEWQRALQVQRECEQVLHQSRAALADVGALAPPQVSTLELSIVEARERLQRSRERAEARAKVETKELIELEALVRLTKEQLDEAERMLQVECSTLRQCRKDASLEVQLKFNSGAAASKVAAAREHQKRLNEEVEEVRRMMDLERKRHERELEDIVRQAEREVAPLRVEEARSRGMGCQ